MVIGVMTNLECSYVSNWLKNEEMHTETKIANSKQRRKDMKKILKKIKKLKSI